VPYDEDNRIALELHSQVFPAEVVDTQVLKKPHRTSRAASPETFRNSAGRSLLDSNVSVVCSSGPDR
jgi:hypothetical protein